MSLVTFASTISYLIFIALFLSVQFYMVSAAGKKSDTNGQYAPKIAGMQEFSVNSSFTYVPIPAQIKKKAYYIAVTKGVITGLSIAGFTALPAGILPPLLPAPYGIILLTIIFVCCCCILPTVEYTSQTEPIAETYYTPSYGYYAVRYTPLLAWTMLIVCTSIIMYYAQYKGIAGILPGFAATTATPLWLVAGGWGKVGIAAITLACLLIAPLPFSSKKTYSFLEFCLDNLWFAVLITLVAPTTLWVSPHIPLFFGAFAHYIIFWVSILITYKLIAPQLVSWRSYYTIATLLAIGILACGLDIKTQGGL